MPERPFLQHRGAHRRTSPAPADHKQISSARRAAFDILQRVETTSAHSDDLLHGPALRPLSQPDRNLATALVLGVLRWQIALDAELNAVLDRPDQPLPVAVRLALRLGIFQLRHMDRIPPHAALSESVELTRAAGEPKSAGLVNAVLRKLLASKRSGTPIVERIDAYAARLGHPAWLMRRWEANYGRSVALAICEYDQHEPAGSDLFSSAPASPDTGDDPGFTDDLLDAGSRLVGEIAAASHLSPSRIWDACAAPGGKTQILAQRHPNAELLATDISPRRLLAMQRRLTTQLTSREVRTLQADAGMLPASEGSFDLVLCDVPCSGTGTLARNPEIRHRLGPADLSRQAQRQREILSSAVSRLSPGGRLVYSTCSLEPEENEGVVQSVLGSKPSLKLICVGPLMEQLSDRKVLVAGRGELNPLLRDGMLRTLPGANFQGDGFFAAVIAREG